MTEWLNLLPGWFALGAGGGGGFFAVKWLVEAFFGRIDRREARLDASADKIIARLERQIEQLSARLDQAEEKLRECQEQHLHAEAKIARMSAILQGQGEVRQRAAEVVAADRLEQRRARK